MKPLLHQHAIQAGLVTIIFLLFLCNLAGLVQFNWHSGGGIQFRSVLFDAHSHAFMLPAVMRTLEFFVLLVGGLVLSALLPLLSPIRASLMTLAVCVVPLYLGLSRPAGNALLPMEFSILTLGMVFVMNMLFGYFRETHSRQKVLDLLGQYIPPQLVDQIAANPGQLSLEGE